MQTLERPRHRLAIGAITLLTLVLTCLLSSGLLAAEEANDPAAGGALMLKGKGAAQAMPAVRLGTDMQVEVTGQIARVRVTQAFRNTSDQWMEATYLYPLPDDGAVDDLKMVIGNRTFVGKIERREEARAAYEKARAEGRKSALVESDRPNLFRNSLANIGPRETVLIAIEYQAPVRQLGGEFSLRLPLVVGARYIPPHSVTDAASAADAASVTAPIAHPDLGKGLNPASITVRLAPGFTPANVISPTHKISVSDQGAALRMVTLAAGEEPADRDFELRWRSASADPTLSLFQQKFGADTYVMAVVTPPAATRVGKAPPREMVFVIDNSGSMGGVSMSAAKQSLLDALATLRPEDTFNVIRFDDTMTQLFEQAVPASADQIAVAQRFTESLEAKGGTEMLPALKAALVDAAPAHKDAVRQVIFLTDGDLSNEREMMAEIAANRGRSRVFMIGIGSAPNTFLMRRMAEAGRGTYTNIGDGGEVKAKMAALLERLQAPAARELTVSVAGGDWDLTPRVLPDLYAGEPLTLLGKSAGQGGTLTVTGMIGDKRWTQTVDFGAATPSPAVAKLWANRRIADIEAQRWSQQIDGDAADKAIARIGLDYGLVTTQTSLIAQDTTPSRPAGARLTQEELPLLLPAGWDFDTLFGQNVSDAQSPPLAADQSQALALPQTATGYLAQMIKGVAALVIGLLGLALGRRRAGRGAMA